MILWHQETENFFSVDLVISWKNYEHQKQGFEKKVIIKYEHNYKHFKKMLLSVSDWLGAENRAPLFINISIWKL